MGMINPRLNYKSVKSRPDVLKCIKNKIKLINIYLQRK